MTRTTRGDVVFLGHDPARHRYHRQIAVSAEIAIASQRAIEFFWIQFAELSMRD